MPRLVPLSIVLLHTAVLVASSPSVDDSLPQFDDHASSDILNADFGPSRDLSYFDDQFTLVGQAAVNPAVAAAGSTKGDEASLADMDDDDATFRLHDDDDTHHLSGMASVPDVDPLSANSSVHTSADLDGGLPDDGSSDLDLDRAEDNDEYDDVDADYSDLAEADGVHMDADVPVDSRTEDAPEAEEQATTADLDSPRVEGLAVTRVEEDTDSSDSTPTPTASAESDVPEMLDDGESTPGEDDGPTGTYTDRMEYDDDLDDEAENDDLDLEADDFNIDDEETDRESSIQTGSTNAAPDTTEKTVSGMSVGTQSIVIEDLEISRAHARLNAQQLHGFAAAPAPAAAPDSIDVPKISADDEEGTVDENGVEQDEEDTTVRGMTADERDEEDDFGFDVDPSVQGLSQDAEIDEDEALEDKDAEGGDSIKGMTITNDGDDNDFETFGDNEETINSGAVKGLAADTDGTEEFDFGEDDGLNAIAPETIKGMASEKDTTGEDMEVTEDGEEKDGGVENIKGMAASEKTEDEDAIEQELGEEDDEEDDEDIDSNEHDLVDEDAESEDEEDQEQEVKGLALERPPVKAEDTKTGSDAGSAVTEDGEETELPEREITNEEDANEDDNESTAGTVKGLSFGEADEDGEDMVQGMAAVKTSENDATSEVSDSEKDEDNAASDFEDEVSADEEESVKGMAATSRTDEDEESEEFGERGGEEEEFGEVEDEPNEGDDELLADTMRSVEA